MPDLVGEFVPWQAPRTVFIWSLTPSSSNRGWHSAYLRRPVTLQGPSPSNDCAR